MTGSAGRTGDCGIQSLGSYLDWWSVADAWDDVDCRPFLAGESVSCTSSSSLSGSCFSRKTLLLLRIARLVET